MSTLRPIASLNLHQIDALLAGDSFPFDVLRGASTLALPHQHAWRESPEGEARCECGDTARFWYCPDNPTQLCRYPVPGPDACEYCGAPSDRSAL
jgi:hypothetical protein